jgi:hypothetical protein
MSDPAEVQWTAATGELQAVRWGRLAVDTIRIQVQVQGVGLDESNVSQIQLMPNPAKDVLYLSQAPQGQMVLYTLMGHVVKTLEPSAQVSVSELPNGSYVLTWESSAGLERRVFSVQH